MSTPQSLIRLMTWLSPAFPTGAFSYSSGLEAATLDETVTNKTDLRIWLTDQIAQGTSWNDLVLLTESWQQSEKGNCHQVADLAKAMSFSKSRHLETTAQGAAFLKAAGAWTDVSKMPSNCPLPVAVGWLAGIHHIELEQALAAFLNAFVSNQIQAALRLLNLGQQAGAELLAELEPFILDTAQKASLSSLEDLGNNCFMADISTMQHEVLASRIFRT